MLKGKSVLITGGSSGIGRALAAGLFEEGANVGIISRRHPSSWEKPMPIKWNYKKHWIQADLKNIKILRRKIKYWLYSQNDNLDILIHCAVVYGNNSRHNFEHTTIGEWNELFAVNTKAPFIITKIALPYLDKVSKGIIISFVSDVVFMSGPGRIGYAASKSALHGMLISLSEEKRNSNIGIIEILPEFQVKTPGIQRRRPENYNYSSYMSPEIFIKPILSIIIKYDNNMNGKCFAINKDGKSRIIKYSNNLKT